MPLFDDCGTKQRYCEKLDRLQAVLFGLLRRAYHDEIFAKLVALKVCNLLAAGYHFHHRHATLASRPVQLLMDPANGCQLRCPGCVHSENATWAEQFEWPAGLMPVPQAAEIFDEFGPFACAAVLYNFGEPLLNRKFPEIVSAAKQYGLFTMTSTNLALPIDAGRLVDCGLDRLTVSADGTSQPTYERFRRRGQLSLVLDNVAALVEAKRQRRSETPYLVWQYLTFEHNACEVDSAFALARDLGVNEIHFVTPFPVDEDDPSIKAVVSGKCGQIVLMPVAGGTDHARPRPGSSRSDARIEAAFDTSWSRRLLETAAAEEVSRASRGTCPWLYHNITVDAARRVMPCCKAPHTENGTMNLVYGRFNGLHSDLMNTERAVVARRTIPSGTAPLHVGSKEMPPCVSCSTQPAAPYGFRVAEHIRMLDVDRAIPEGIYETLRSCALYAAAQGAR